MAIARIPVHRDDRNGNCDCPATVLQYFRGRRRRLVIDALVALASIVVAGAIVISIDSRAGGQMARIVRGTPSEASIAVQLRDDTMTAARSAWEMSQLHAPLAAFAGVGAILMLFMLRAK